VSRWKEVGEMFEQKLVQGAAELGKAINSQADAYVPYGDGQKMPEVDSPATSYTDALREASQREVPEQSQEIER
jgi:hypothetical protein